MKSGRQPLFVAFGLLSVAVSMLSVVDMFVPKPFDGISPEPGRDGIVVERVAPGSAADAAGIEAGDRILGIGDVLVSSAAEAADELIRHPIGEPVNYLVENHQGIEIRELVPGANLRANPFFVYDAVLGLLFLLLGFFVLRSRPDDEAARVYFLLCDLFLVFLTCRLRPSSYYWVDFFVEKAGTVALFLLPAVFLHFFLIFPERKRFDFVDESGETPSRFRLRLDRWLNERRFLYGVLYTLPPLVYVISLLRGSRSAQMLYGAPPTSWVLLGNYFLAGLGALAHSWLKADPRRRRQLAPVLVGSILGTVPLILFGVVLPALTGEARFLLFGTVPLVLIPLTFGYAIVRYQLLNVRLVVRKGLLYAATTAIVSGVYALAIASSNWLLGATIGSSPATAFVLAVAVVLAFDPLRQRMQRPIDRLFFRDRVDFARALHDASAALRAELSLDRIQEILTATVVQATHGSGADILLVESSGHIFTAKSERPLPGLSPDATLVRRLADAPLPRLVESLKRQGLDAESFALVEAAEASGAELLVPLVFESRLLGILLLRAKKSEEAYSREELELLATLANQAAVAIESARLHREMTHQAELERDLEIARDIQTGLFPRALPQHAGIDLHANSIPARVVGGDFYDAFRLDGGDGRIGFLLGDVSGKSIPGALLMVASREILYATARREPEPARVFREASERIYAIKRRMFVALGYYVLDAPSRRLSYSIAGMPTPILCRERDGKASLLPLPEIRMPLGGLRDVPYDDRTIELEAGDLLLLYSDGFSETVDPAGEPFGEERIERRLWDLRGESLPAIGRTLVDEVRRHAAGADPYDDMTFLLLRVAK